MSWCSTHEPAPYMVGKAGKEGPSVWVLATRTGGLNEAPDSWRQPGPALAVGPSEEKTSGWQISVSCYFCDSDFKINKS